MIQNKIILWSIVILFVFSGCSSENSSESDSSKRLYLTSGESGCVEPAMNGFEYTISLYEIVTNVHWISLLIRLSVLLS